MTDGGPRIPVVPIAGSVFCVALTFLALQVRAGNDPAIGAGHQNAEARPVVVRRIIERRVVERTAGAPAGAAGGTQAAPSAAATDSSPAPAPAPAPAPVVTRAS